MKIKKTMTRKALEANRDNAQLSTGPSSEDGKRRSRRSALKHGILAKTVLFKNEEDEVAFHTFLDDLEQDQKPRDTIERMQLEDVAITRIRLARATRLEQRLYRRRNAATEIINRAISANSKVLGMDALDVQDNGGWDVSRLELSGRKGRGEYRKQDVRAGEDRKDQEFTLRATLSSPLDLASRYEALVRREHYRSLDRFLKLKKRRSA